MTVYQNVESGWSPMDGDLVSLADALSTFPYFLGFTFLYKLHSVPAESVWNSAFHFFSNPICGTIWNYAKVQAWGVAISQW